MSMSCMQAIKQQLEAMPLEEFEDLLKGVAHDKGHEGMPQHAELLSQLKHHVKVQPDEPIQTKVSDKEHRTIWNSLNQRDNKSHRLSNSNSNSNSSSSSGGGCSNINGNLASSGNHNSHYNYPKLNSLTHFASNTRTLSSTGDQNANPVSSTSDSSSPAYSHQPVHSLIQGKHEDHCNQNQFHSNSLTYGNSFDGDPGGRSTRSLERDPKNNDNTFSATNKNSYNADDDDQDEDDDKPEDYTGTLPAQYILPSVTKYNSSSCKDLTVFTKTARSTGTIPPAYNPTDNLQPARESSPVASSNSWDVAQPSVSTHNATPIPAYGGKASPPENEPTFGSIQGTSPSPTPFATGAKSPTDGSQISDKPNSLRAGDKKKKKGGKNLAKETVIESHKLAGFQGDKSIDELLEFVEGDKVKVKKLIKERKPKESKPKGNEKQVLSKAASLDENSLGYGSKKSEELPPRNKNSKEVEKKNSANITKSASEIRTEEISKEISKSSNTSAFKIAHDSPPVGTKINKTSVAPLVNGNVPVAPVPKADKVASAKVTSAVTTKSSITVKSQSFTDKVDVSQSTSTVAISKSDTPFPLQPSLSKQALPLKVLGEKKQDDEKFPKPDEADGPYVLVQSQSKKKREKKNRQQRKPENFTRQNPDQARRENRPRRGPSERRKSVGSVPGSGNECSDDDDSVRSLPAGECTPRERIPKPCSSSGGTPQTSYADIARISKDETGKVVPNPPATPPSAGTTGSNISAKPPVPKPPTAPTPVVAVPVDSDTNFPALSPPNSDKTAPVATTVWYYRAPRPTEPDVQKSSANSKQDDVPPIEGTLPPTGLVHPEPLKCSTIPLIESTTEAALSGINSTDAPSEKEAVTSSKKLSTPPVESPAIICNGTLPRNSSSVEVGQTAQHITNKIPVNKKLEDKKAKDKSAKLPDESQPKISSCKAVENGDLTTSTHAPVVFCGGKFDSSQLPVGQKSGFEFGFGVIEALNDTGAAGDSSAITKIPVDCIVASPPSVGQPSANESSRSQDQMSTPINGAESQTEKVPLKKDQLSKSIEKPNQKNANPNTSISLTRVQSPTIASSVPQQSLPKPHEEPPKIETVVESQSTASANVPLQTIKNATSNPQTGGNATTEKSPKIDIAQLYRPPKCTMIPTTVRLAGEYLDAYASRLSRQIRDGNVLFHRV